MRAAVLTALLGMLAGSAAQAAAPGSAAGDPSIVIGFVATRSGAGALTGLDMVDGFSLALKQLGSRFANQEVRVAAIDDKGSPDLARKGLAKLLETERLDFLVTAVGPASQAAMAGLLAKSRVFVLHLDNPPAALAGADCNPHSFTLAPPVDAAHAVLGAKLAADGVTKVVVIAPDTGLADQSVAAFKSGFPHDVLVLRPKRGAAMFPRELTAIRKAEPQAVYSMLNGGMGGAFVRAFRDDQALGTTPLYATAETLARPSLPSMGDAALDVLSVSAWSPDLDNPGNKRLVGDFESEFGRPATARAARGYDAVLLLDSALKSVGGKTGDAEALRAGLRRAEFSSVRGAFHFNHNHQPYLTYHLRRVVKDARGRLTHEILTDISKDWRDPAAASCSMHWPEEYAPPAPKPAKKPPGQ